MRFLGLVAGMALALSGTAQAASFSLVSTSDTFIGQGQSASFVPRGYRPPYGSSTESSQ